jgi:hypothetical protein
VDLLLNKGVVDIHSLHKVSHSFAKVVPNEKTSITTGVAIVDNTGSAIQVRGHTLRMVLLDTGAQPMILGVQFAKKMGMLESKLWKSMWQIRIASGSIEEVLGESLDLIVLNFNEGTNQELCLQVRCLVTNATSYDVFIGQKALFFHHVSQLTTGSSMRTIEWIGRLMATTWDTYPLIYMGTIVLWLTIVCSRKHTLFLTSNKLATSG